MDEDTRRRLIDRGTEILRRRMPDVALTVQTLADDDAVALLPAIRGGGVLIVAADSTALFAESTVPWHAALAEFRRGGRTVFVQ